MSLRHLILGLVDEQPLSGYDINKYFNMTIQHFWNADQSQIYRALHKLLAEEMVTLEHIVQEDSPDKKVYHITDKGREELHQWLTTPVPEPPAREAWMGQLFFGATLHDDDALIALLTDYQERYEQERAILMQVREMFFGKYSDDTLPHKSRLRRMTVNYGIRSYECVLAWIDDCIKEIRAHPSSEDEPL